MKTEHFYYHPFTVIINALITVCFFVMPIIYLLFFERQIAGYAFVLLMTVFSQSAYQQLNGLYRFTLNKPVIELTNDYYIDYISSVKIRWKDINCLKESGFDGWSFLEISMYENQLFFTQIRNPIHRVVLKSVAWSSNYTFRTNISFVNGDNEEIRRRVSNYQRKVLEIAQASQ